MEIKINAGRMVGKTHVGYLLYKKETGKKITFEEFKKLLLINKK